MESHLKCKDCSKKTKKKLRHTKPYWPDELTQLWKQMNEKVDMHKKSLEKQIFYTQEPNLTNH